MGLIGYVRVSRIGGREGEGYISPDVQRSAITGYADELGMKITRWLDDQDYSGTNIERPDFQTALSLLEAGEADGIVVMAIDRFSRGVSDGIRIVREIVARDQIFASCHERIDPRTPEGQWMLVAFLNNGELFANQRAQGWRIAKVKAVARGVHIGATPIGYTREKSMPLEVDPHYGPAMTELFRRAATGEYTDAALARWFNDRAPRAAGMPWQTSELRRWFANRLYLGEVHYGRGDDPLVNTEAHPPLTDPETWEACQRKAPATRRPTARQFLLSGRVRCAACRYSMGGQTYGGHRGQTPVYRCPNGPRRGCPEPSVIVAERLEAFVIEQLEREFGERRARGIPSDVDIVGLDRAAQDATAEVAAYVADLDARRLLGDDAWREGLELRTVDRDRKVVALERARSDRAAVEKTKRLSDLDFHDLRDFLLGAVGHIFVRRRRGAPPSDRALIVWSDDPRPIDVPGPHRSTDLDPITW